MATPKSIFPLLFLLLLLLLSLSIPIIHSTDPPPLSCSELKGIGSLNTTCQLSYTLNFTTTTNITGTGNLYILHGVTLTCSTPGCQININISGSFILNPFAQIKSGSIQITSSNATFFENSVLNATGRGGEPPEASTGTPNRAQGGGGGHGGRGATCVVDNTKKLEDEWGGDTYSWETLGVPESYGSRGDTTNRDEDYGVRGGGRVWVVVEDDLVQVNGMVLADGGDGGIKGGGGSGGSIFIMSRKM